MQKITGYSSWLAWLLASLFYAYQYILRTMPNILMPEIMSRFDMDAAMFGQFSGIYYICYVLAHLPLGMWLDRRGPKYIMPICIALSVIGVQLLAVSETRYAVFVSRALIAVGSSGAILGLFKVIHLGFSENRFALMLGMGVSIGVLGALYGGQPVNSLFELYGYTAVLQYISYVGALLAGLSFIFMPRTECNKLEKISFLGDISKIWATKRIIIVAMLGGLMIGPMEGFADAWAASFLVTAYNISSNEAAFLSSLIFFGMCGGTSLMTYIADRTKWYYEIIIFSAFSMCLIFLLIMFVQLDIGIVGVLLVAVGILCAYQIIVVYKGTSYASEDVAGFATAVVNMIMMSFGYLFHSVIGKAMEIAGSVELVDGIRTYSADSYKYGLAVIPIALAIAGFGFLRIRKST